MAIRHFCTYFNSGYLDRALVLIESMRRHVPSFTLDVLCFDEAAYDFFEQHSYPEIRCQRLSAFEERQPDVAAVKSSRSRAEYFFTCTSAWINDVLERHQDMDVLTYLDADLCFFGSPEPVFEAFADKDVLITEHGFASDDLKHLRFGRFNVGWLSFRNNRVGRECLRRWRDQCVAWCFDRLEDGKFADQKYLDEWPERYGNRLMIGPPGLNTGPWSLSKAPLSVRDGCLRVGDYPLIVYHFQGVRLFSRRHFYLGHYFDAIPADNLRLLYFPYVKLLVQTAEQSGLLRAGGQERYKLGNIGYRCATGYWVDHVWISCALWFLQRCALWLQARFCKDA
ncbi:MAG TPA: hypothetical protein P5026_09295 [Kiritimatiellia bacterium]|nr:hypothetical protein [Kiritimatiellia bacterium]